MAPPRSGSSREQVLGEAEPHPQRDQALLGPVVQVTFDAPALQVG